MKIVKLGNEPSLFLDNLLECFAEINIEPMGHTLRYLANKNQWVHISLPGGEQLKHDFQYCEYFIRKLNKDDELLITIDFSANKTKNSVYEIVQDNPAHNYFVEQSQPFQLAQIKNQLDEVFVNKIIIGSPSGKWLASFDRQTIDVIFLSENLTHPEGTLLPKMFRSKTEHNYNLFHLNTSSNEFSGTHIKVKTGLPFWLLNFMKLPKRKPTGLTFT